MLETQDDFLTVEELCELLKIGHNAAYRLLNSGEIKAIRNGRVVSVKRTTLGRNAPGYQSKGNPAGILNQIHIFSFSHERIQSI